jgi:SAM-dependent methyltransferase
MRAVLGRFVAAAVARAARVAHSVGRLHCPVCDKPVLRFQPMPESFFRTLREAGWPHPLERFETLNLAAYTCPRCGSTDRERLIALYLNEHLARQREPIAVLDIAPYPPLAGFIRRAIGDRGGDGRYRSADLYMAGVDDRIDICDMSIYSDQSFDLVLCSHVLEHVPDDCKAMAELFRVLRPGGRALVLVPIVLGLQATDEDPAVTDPRERRRRFAQDDHVRQYAKDDFTGRLAGAGFRVERFGADHFGADRLAKHGITAQSALYVAGRPGPCGR